MASPLITLLTDLGVTGAYVGIVKGVLYARAPEVRIVDLTHTADPGSLHAAAHLLAGAVPYFMPGTVHLVLTDPSSAPNHRIIAAKVNDQYLLAPDNGVVSALLDEYPPAAMVTVENSRFLLEPHRHTFHSRLIYAPVAAALVRGDTRLEELGPALVQWTRLPDSRARHEPDGSVVGKVVHIDRFGNLVTNIHGSQLRAQPHISMGYHSIARLSDNYGDVRAGAVLAIIGSTGYLEISINRGSAAELLFSSAGTPVRVEAA